MNKKPKNNSYSHPAKSINTEKKKKEILEKQGSPILESQNSALKKILETLFQVKPRDNFVI